MTDAEHEQIDENDATSDDDVEAQIHETVGSTTSRRNFLRLTGAAAGAAATGSYYGSPVQEAEAIAPVVAVGAAVAAGAGVGVGWALREYTADEADAPPEGLTASALRQQTYQTALTRQSTNKSTFIDNKNIVDSGAQHAAYADGKIAAIEAINNEKQKSEVKTAATNAVDSYATTVIKNLLKSWNESVRELDTMAQTISSHSDATPTDLLELRVDEKGHIAAYNGMNSWNDPKESNYELPDGSAMAVLEAHATINIDGLGGSSDDMRYNDEPADVWYSPINSDFGNINTNIDISSISGHRVGAVNSDSNEVEYLIRTEWKDLLSTIETAFGNARDGIITWVNNVYDQVQAGELDTGELLTPRELAEMTASEKDSFDQAVADLQALNISTDLDREAEIFIPQTNATLYGTLASTQSKTFSSGTTITPGSDSADYYFTYDVSRAEGTWEAYDAASGVDGGVVTFTSEPYEGHRYHITTSADETATVLASDFTGADTNSDGTNDEWTVDLSEQLETVIAEIDSVEFEAAVDETRFETIQLDTEFDIVSFTDTSTGESKESATTERSQPQTDNNYVSKSEWEEMQKRQEELIEKYENQQSGGGLVTTLFGSSGIPAWGVGGIIAAILAYAATGDDS